VWSRNSRNVVQKGHLTCPICQHQIDLDHEDALDQELELFAASLYASNETLPTGFAFR